tara:strand:- start:16393 stop:16665 length:273 start_codon:yes stop_codon:yes gene_type:complete
MSKVLIFCVFGVFILIIILSSFLYNESFVSHNNNCENGICCPEYGMPVCPNMKDGNIRDMLCESRNIECQLRNDKKMEKGIKTERIVFDS